MTHATASIGTLPYAVTIDVGGRQIAADEPQVNGGGNTGPAPYDLLLASLAACTAITLRMYAERKQWELRAVRVALHFARGSDGESIRRVLAFDGILTGEQRARLADIAERTPVTLTLKRGLTISTEVEPNPAAHAAEVSARLDEALDESFPASDSPEVSP